MQATQLVLYDFLPAALCAVVLTPPGLAAAAAGDALPLSGPVQRTAPTGRAARAAQAGPSGSAIGVTTQPDAGGAAQGTSAADLVCKRAALAGAVQASRHRVGDLHVPRGNWVLAWPACLLPLTGAAATTSISWHVPASKKLRVAGMLGGLLGLSRRVVGQDIATGLCRL
jgi:hypothetical protein